MEQLHLLTNRSFGFFDTMSLVFLVCASVAAATPSIILPIAAQYPPTAYVGKEFRFQFSKSTFASDDGKPLSYQIQDAPSWISVDSLTRIFSGTPTSEDVGTSNLALIARDSSGSIKAEFKLLVARKSVVWAPQNVTTQLVKYGTLSGPRTLSFITGDSFHIHFVADTFMGPLGIEYFATSADNTPLPAWVQFEPQTRSFSGVAPPLVPTPQTFGIRLIASLVSGFSEASVTFFLVVNDHKLGFHPFERAITVRRGARFSYKLLLKSLLLDGRRAQQSEIAHTIANTPDWLEFNSTTLDLEGLPPSYAIAADAIIKVTDIYQDTAEALIHLYLSASPLHQQIAQITAVIGDNFKYKIEDKTFSARNLSLSCDFGRAASWLHFNSSTLMLYGHVPGTLRPQLLHFSITEKSPFTLDTLAFSLRLVESNTPGSSRTHLNPPKVTSRFPTSGHQKSNTKPTTNSARANPNDVDSDSRVGIALGCTFAFLILVVVLMLWRRYRLRKGSHSCLGGNIRPDHDRGDGGPNAEKHDKEPDLDMSATKSIAPQLDFRFGNNDTNSEDRHSITLDEETRHGGTEEKLTEASQQNGLERSESSNPIYVNVLSEPASWNVATKSRQHESSASSVRKNSFPSRRVLTGLGHGRASNNTLNRLAAIDAFVSSRDSGSWYTSSSESEPSMRSQMNSFPHTPGTSRNAMLESVPENPERPTIRQVINSNELLRDHSVDDRPLEEKRQSYVRRRASTSRDNVIFGSRIGKTPPSEASSRRSRLLKKSRLYRSRSSSVGVGRQIPPPLSFEDEANKAELREPGEWLERANASSGNSQAEVQDAKGANSKDGLSRPQMPEEGYRSQKGEWIRRPSSTNLRWARSAAVPLESQDAEVAVEGKTLGDDSEAQPQSSGGADDFKLNATEAGMLESLSENGYQRLLSSQTLASDASSAALSSRFI